MGAAGTQSGCTGRKHGAVWPICAHSAADPVPLALPHPSAARLFTRRCAWCPTAPALHLWSTTMRLRQAWPCRACRASSSPPTSEGWRGRDVGRDVGQVGETGGTPGEAAGCRCFHTCCLASYPSDSTAYSIALDASLVCLQAHEDHLLPVDCRPRPGWPLKRGPPLMAPRQRPAGWPAAAAAATGAAACTVLSAHFAAPLPRPLHGCGSSPLVCSIVAPAALHSCGPTL